MTAEVVVMNKMAVALAADSAVTVVGENGKKVYNTVNKLFRFSASQPVGIMIYGNSELMGIPWETIIKIYIKKLADSNFKTLQEYAEKFISYLDNGNPLFPESIQKDYVFVTVSEFFKIINNFIENKIEETIYEEEELSKKEYRKIISDTINNFYKDLIARDELAAIAENHETEIIEKYERQIKDAREAVLGKLPMSKTSINKLIKMGGLLFSKQINFSRFTSGIVIAGFGEDEVFPSVTSYLIEGVANNKLKYIQGQGTESTHTAGIIPFAQQDMVYTFAEGIDPNYKEYFNEYLNDLFNGYPSLVLNCLSNLKIELSDLQRKSIIKKLKELGCFLVNEFGENMTEYHNTMHTKPLISSVSVLPKEELAILAESLVNLTALKQKMSMDSETVGGSIDVAVISKGDGFVWIKQKRYFQQELNPHFNC